MTRYKTKPFEIKAIQFTGIEANWWDVQNFCGYRVVDDVAICNFQRAGTYRTWDDKEIVAEVYDKLHSTWVGVKYYQYIIEGAKGEYYPCDYDIFQSKYEVIND